MRNTAVQTFASGDEGYRTLLESLARLAGQGGMAESPGALIAAISALAPDDVSESEVIDRTLLARNLSQIDATLVAYAMGRRNMYAFVMDRDHMRVVSLGSHEAIERAATDLSNRLRAPEVVQSRLRKTTEQLARLVLWPLTSYVTRERIVIVPDGALHTVPFALLPWSKELPDQLVVHRAETVLVPSASLIAAPRPLREAATNDARFDLIGAPIFRMADWQRECATGAVKVSAGTPAVQQLFSSWMESLPSLPGAHAEMTAIAQLLRTSRPGSHVVTRLGCEATPEALVRAAQQGGALLHIATYGHVDAYRPRLSALALTPDAARLESGNSVFDLLNILNLRLRARLVVLSASETSRGRLLAGEGVLGPAQAFLQAGAASVIASHWKVEDDTTAAFMTTFYEYLTRDRLPVSAALRRAQLDQARRSPSHHWAAFSLYGRPDSTI
jgi:CHAT domain-containing protein